MADKQDDLSKYLGWTMSAGVLLSTVMLRSEIVGVPAAIGAYFQPKDDTLIPLTMNCAASYPLHDAHCVFDRANDPLFAQMMRGLDQLSTSQAEQASHAVERNLAALPNTLPDPDRHALLAMLAYESATRGPRLGTEMLAHLLAYANDKDGHQELPRLRFVTQGDTGPQSPVLPLYAFLQQAHAMQAPKESVRVDGADMVIQGRAMDGPLLPVWSEADVAAVQARALKLRQRLTVEKTATGPRLWTARAPGGVADTEALTRGR